MVMQKLDYLQQKRLNSTDDLRNLLKQLEDIQPQIKLLNPTQALHILRNLDQVHDLFDQLEQIGADLTGERGRFEATQTFLKQHAGRLLKGLGGPGILADYRPKPAPARDRWWWYIHERVAEQQRHKLRQTIIIVGVVVFLLVGLLIAFNTVLAPSPEAVARAEAERVSMDAFGQGNYEAALAAVEESLAVVPDDPGLLILHGVVLQALGREQEAQQSFAQSEQSLAEPANFYISRGQIYLRTNQLERAEADARAALMVDDQASRAWLLLGQALEFQNRRFEAVPAYQQAGELALSHGEDQVVVLARLALGRINFGTP